MDAERWTARARVALGTLVEIRLPAAEARDDRFRAAFAAVDRVARRMNPADRASDLARIGRGAHCRPVTVDAQTFEVLALAMRLFAASDGRFDVTRRAPRARIGTLAAIELIAPRLVRSRGKVALDLGGIAKGYAVDRAVVALHEAGATSGVVNAGGDLRAFGPAWIPVDLRDPRAPTRTLPLGLVRECAVATSADYFRNDHRALLDRRKGCSQHYGASITVVAPSCMLADALTKLVALDRRRAPALLARFDAQAFVVEVRNHELVGAASGRPHEACLRLAA